MVTGLMLQLTAAFVLWLKQLTKTLHNCGYQLLSKMQLDCTKKTKAILLEYDILNISEYYANTLQEQTEETPLYLRSLITRSSVVSATQ